MVNILNSFRPLYTQGNQVREATPRSAHESFHARPGNKTGLATF